MKKYIRFSLMLDQHEKDALDKLAEFEGGLSKAALIRRLIRQTAADNRVWNSSLPQTSSDKTVWLGRRRTILQIN